MPKTTKRTKPANPSQQSMPIVGIDLGTTNSAVAILEARQPVLIPGSSGSSLLPSVVHRTPDGQIVVGSDAEGARVAMPNRTVAAAKRHMGSDTTLQLGDTSLRAEEISSLVLKELKSWVHRHLQLDEDQLVEAVITVPAYFTDEQRRATKRAGELAGFVVERIINEPTAAALAFGLGRTDQEQTLVVYDLGGGTFDASVVELFDGILEVKASKGNSHLGGEDFDWLLVNHLAQMVKDQSGADPLSELRAKALLKQHAEAAKKELSFQESVEVNIPLLMFHDGNPVPLTVTLQRSEFAAMIASHIEETIASVRTVLEDSDLQPAAVDAVLLVGGSTRIPLVQQAIIDVFGKQPLMDVNPDEAVALGAAVQAGIKSGEISAETLIATDVAPFSMGIAVAEDHGTHITDGHFSVIIPRNTTIPTKRTESYVTAYPGQKAVAIEVYQGEGAMVAENHPLGEFHFEGFPVNPYREEVFTVTFGYNLNGILEVEAQSVSNGKTMSVQIHDQIDRDSKAAFKDSLNRLQSLQEKRRSEYHQESLPLDFDLPEPLAVAGEDTDADLLDDATVATIWDLEDHMPADVTEFLADLRSAPEAEIISLGQKALEMIEITLAKSSDLTRLMKRQLKGTQRDLKQGLRMKDRAAIIEAVLLTASVAMLPNLMSDFSEDD